MGFADIQGFPCFCSASAQLWPRRPQGREKHGGKRGLDIPFLSTQATHFLPSVPARPLPGCHHSCCSSYPEPQSLGAEGKFGKTSGCGGFGSWLPDVFPVGSVHQADSTGPLGLCTGSRRLRSVLGQFPDPLQPQLRHLQQWGDALTWSQQREDGASHCSCTLPLAFRCPRRYVQQHYCPSKRFPGATAFSGRWPLGTARIMAKGDSGGPRPPFGKQKPKATISKNNRHFSEDTSWATFASSEPGYL